MALTAGDRLGPYEVVALLGAGGMGEVYRARDTRLDRDVAVKVLPAGSVGNAQAESRFDREARAIAALNHPNICALYDVGRHGDRSFLVMELLEGETLHHRLARGPLDLGALVDDAIALADALDTAHARGMLHRDLKPANLFLTSRGQIKILDFGLTKAIGTSDDATHAAGSLLTGAGTAVGTMGYMSPEQLRGEAIDARSDLFALGAVLYEMATGRRAFQGTTGAVISAAILGELPAAPRAIRPELPVKLEETILKALEKDRDVRCQSAADLRADLKRVKRDLPVEAGRPLPAGSGVVDPRAASSSIPAATATSSPRPASSDTQVVVGLVKRHQFAVALAILTIAAVVAGGVWLTRRAAPPPAPASSASALQIQPLTVTGNAGLGALSPDARFVAYLRRDGAEFSLWVRQLATQSDVPILPVVPGRRFIGLVVTPDGSYVDFVATDKGVSRPDLWRVPFLGGTPRRIASDVWSATGWAPDGRHMAFVRMKQIKEGNEESVIVADGDGANERAVATRRNPVRFLQSYFSTAPIARPSWSSDGRTLLVLGMSRLPARQGRSHELVLIDVATASEIKSVPVDRVLLQDAAWLDESHALVNGLVPGRRPTISRMDLTTGVLTPLTQDFTTFIGVSLTTDHQAAVTTHLDVRSGISVGDAKAVEMAEVVPESPALSELVKLDRTGGLVYQAQTANGVGVYAIRPGERTPVLVVDNGISPEVTADGRTIVFRRPSDKVGLYRVNIDGSGLTLLVEGDPGSAVILRDDRTVLFTSNRSGVQAMWSVPLAGGPAREILHRFVGAGSLLESPDGRRLLFSGGVVDGRSLNMVCDLPDCTNPHEWPVRLGRWTPDGHGVAYVDRTDPKNIWVQPIDGGSPRPLTKFTEKDVRDFAWSPDGARLAITRGTGLADIVLIKGIR